ncbi:TPA: hypothetical protein NJV01_003354 [Escherichia coli]|nr:hypothetical protein [Escherichia coli]HCG2937277.1 hypothetical protein [Escherichia coli]HCG3100385.1 hypothetical protein [Escherichia coli]
MKDEKLLSRFLRDTAHHNVIIERDEGVYRHLIFKAPGTNSYRFDIITWPGYLTVTGDMGTWTFSRERDMITHFFPAGTAGGINPGYWSEKIEAGTHGWREAICYDFDDEAFEKSLKEWLGAWREDRDEDDIEKAEEVIQSLINEGFSDARSACYAVYNANWPMGVDSFEIAESIGYSLMKYSLHFLWICYAVVWGIERYLSTKLVNKSMSTFLACHALTKDVDYREAA